MFYNISRLRILYLNSNCLTCVPNLKIFRDNHVVQEFNKSYHKRKSKKQPAKPSRKSSVDAATKALSEAIVKDLAIERVNSEMNMHSSNILRNSFIIEEDEDNDQTDSENFPDQPIASAATIRHDSVSNKRLGDLMEADMMEKSFELPFSELVYINLADNQIEEEDDLISLVSWPMLNEIIIYGNPIVYNNVGHPPLLKQYLVDRLGINLQRTRPLKALKTPLLLPQREHRIINTNVPKIPKMPVEMRMLTYNQDSESESSRGTNVSSNSNSSNFEESYVNQNKSSEGLLK